MFNNIFAFVLILTIITILLVLIQRKIKGKGKRYTVVLPAMCLLFSFFKSIPSFEKAFYIQFSFGAFLASLLVFLILNIPTIALLILSRKLKNHSVL